jgi:hypothetical protein
MAKAYEGLSGSFPFPDLPAFVLRTTADKKVRALATTFRARLKISNNISRGFNPFRKAVDLNSINSLMERRTSYCVSLLVGGMLMASGCIPDASHDNPLDPASNAFSNSGTLSGNVFSFYQPYAGIAGALVTIQPSGVAVVSNSAGAYSIDGVPPGDVQIIVSRSGYLTDTVDSKAVIGNESKLDIHLDALPVVGTCQVLTRKIDQWWPHAVYSAVVNAAVTDPDGLGDVTGATLQVDTMKFVLTYVPDQQVYQVAVDAAILPQGSLEWLVGKSFNVTVRDRIGATTSGKPFSLSRIIQDAPIPLSPTALDTASASPQLFWVQPSLQFPYSYKIELFRLDLGVPSLLWSVSNLSSSLSSFQYPNSLSTGTFFWTISVVDEFGNLSRSKEASFIVNGQ